MTLASLPIVIPVKVEPSSTIATTVLGWARIVSMAALRSSRSPAANPSVAVAASETKNGYCAVRRLIPERKILSASASGAPSNWPNNSW